MELPLDLEDLALLRFDRLLHQGKLLYGHSEPRTGFGP